MKKIAEIFIGSNIPYYDKFGSPSLYVVQANHRNEVETKRKWHRLQDYQAYCKCCDSLFSFGNGYSLHNWDRVVCPCCGKNHKKHEIMYSNSSDTILGSNIRIALIEMKTKIVIKAYYDGILLGKNAFNDAEFDMKVIETYIFDIENNVTIWEKVVNKIRIEQQNLGYIDDFSKMEEKTIFYFLNYKHKIFKGNCFRDFLKILRNTIKNKVKKIKKWTKIKSLYVCGTHKKHILSNILNCAYRTRFLDSANILSGSNEFQNWRNYFMDNSIFINGFEDIIFEKMNNKKEYYQAVSEILHIPYTKTTRRFMQNIENWFPLVQAYSINDINITQQVLPKFIEWNHNGYYGTRIGYNSKQTIKDIVKYISIFYPKYTNTMKIEKILRNINEVKDTIALWNIADKITRNKFNVSQISIKNLHDWLSVAVLEQQDREIIFNIDENISSLYTQKLTGFQTEMIKKYSQLKAVANKLKNCAAGYKNSISNEHGLIVITNNENKPVALMEINKNNLVQAKLFDNKSVKLQPEINALIIEFARLTNLSIKTDDVLQYKNISEINIA